ncbi:hypothetical protein FALCPG4_017674 [Fusarium falciforme]
MQSADEVLANSIFRQIRQGASPESIVQQIRTGDAFVELRLSTETRYRFNFPYKKDMPSKLLSSNSPYLRSYMYEAVHQSRDAATYQSDPLLGDQDMPHYLKPYQASKLNDPRLESILPSEWTNVSKDNELMRGLIRLFFVYEYPWYSFFHKDHFLDDMLSSSEDCCSSLLVNVVLALACGCDRLVVDRSEYWNPQSLAYRFFAEAKRLWELEKNRGSRLTTIQSAGLINVIYNMQSMDRLGMIYTVQAVAMARDLGIFGALDPMLPRKMQVSYGFTAWSLFNWTSLQHYHFMTPPIVREPPRPPLPDVELDSAWYGDISLLYPPVHRCCPMNFGHLFKAKSELAVILNQISLTLLNNQGISPQETFDTVNETSAKLETWYRSLPACLSPAEIVFPVQIKLHLLFHNVIINLHELLSSKAAIFATDPRWHASRSVLRDSKLHFEILMRLYFLRHGYEYSDTYLTHTLAVLAFMALGRLNSAVDPTAGSSIDESEDLISTIFLAAKGLADQDHPDKKRLGKMIEEFTSLNVEERPPGGGSEPGSDQPEA